METVHQGPVFAAEALPTADNILVDAARINSRVNRHKHSATCWKAGCKTCRLTYKRQQAEVTYFAGLKKDPNISSTLVPTTIPIAPPPN